MTSDTDDDTLLVSKTNVTYYDIITEPDVKERFPHHVQPVPSTSEGKFNINIAVLYFKPLNEIFGKLILKIMQSTLSMSMMFILSG